MLNRIFLGMVGLIFCMTSMADQDCTHHDFAIQVLGSGGPELSPDRASASYVVWLDGKARVLIDMGGGSLLRLGQSGAAIEDLNAILLTHLHADHTADLPALVKASYFASRTQPLPLFGPKGNRQFPGTGQFVKQLLGAEGAYRYLSSYLMPDNDQDYWLDVHEVAAMDAEQVLLSQTGLQIRAIQVLHGSVPALAWRIDAKGKSVVLSGDTSGNDDHLEKLANNADILVAHHAIPESAEGVARALHMPPSLIGQIAANAQVKSLVLAHRMKRALGLESRSLDIIRRHFNGPVFFANDLDCFH